MKIFFQRAGRAHFTNHICQKSGKGPASRSTPAVELLTQVICRNWFLSHSIMLVLTAWKNACRMCVCQQCVPSCALLFWSERPLKRKPSGYSHPLDPRMSAAAVFIHGRVSKRTSSIIKSGSVQQCQVQMKMASAPQDADFDTRNYLLVRLDTNQTSPCKGFRCFSRTTSKDVSDTSNPGFVWLSLICIHLIRFSLWTWMNKQIDLLLTCTHTFYMSTTIPPPPFQFLTSAYQPGIGMIHATKIHTAWTIEESFFTHRGWGVCGHKAQMPFTENVPRLWVHVICQRDAWLSRLLYFQCTWNAVVEECNSDSHL